LGTDANPLLGVVLHAIGGLAAASFYIPYKRVQGWSWETYWIVGGVFSWIIAPWAVSLTILPSTLAILRDVSGRQRDCRNDSEHIAATMQWLCRAQDASGGGPGYSTLTGCCAANLQITGVAGGVHLGLGLAHAYAFTGAGGTAGFQFGAGATPSSVIAAFQISPTGATTIQIASDAPSIIYPGGIARY
jgi:hypothetical protein